MSDQNEKPMTVEDWNAAVGLLPQTCEACQGHGGKLVVGRDDEDAKWLNCGTCDGAGEVYAI